jgi:hypothetical protein
MKFNKAGIPPAADHPLWQRWFAHAYAEDLRSYGVHDYLHHYIRSYDSLMSVLASQTLWASDVRSLSDTTEFEHGLPICYEALKLIREPSLQEHVELVKQGLTERFRHRTFVTCFSTRNDLRSQWDSYADEQRGSLVTFDSLVISALSAPQGYRLMPVEYGREAQLDRARHAVRRAVNDLSGTLPGLSPRDSLWSIQARFVLLATEMFYFCASFKAPRFRPEHEWRLIYSRLPDEADALPIQRRSAADREIDYVVVELTQRYARRALPSFAEIRIGPRTSRNVENIVRRYLKDFAKFTKCVRQRAF